MILQPGDQRTFHDSPVWPNSPFSPPEKTRYLGHVASWKQLVTFAVSQITFKQIRKNSSWQGPKACLRVDLQRCGQPQTRLAPVLCSLHLTDTAGGVEGAQLSTKAFVTVDVGKSLLSEMSHCFTDG